MLVNAGLEQTRQVTRIVLHENWEWSRQADDIAILFIAAPFSLNANVQPIALPQKCQVTTGNVVVAGWGYTNYTNIERSATLRYVQIPVVDDATCQELYNSESTWSPILDSMICAGDVGKGACHYDGGAPVRSVEGNYLAGIVSQSFVSFAL